MSAVKHNMSLSMILSPPMQDQEPEQQEVVKRRAACEECRIKKLKCSGTHPACTRCVREGITCYYSPQKAMGRPKKRARSSEHTQIDESTTRRKSIAIPRIQARNATSSQASGQQQERTKSPEHEVPSAYDMGSYASAFNPDDSLQPWLQQSFPEVINASWNSPSAHTLPALTPDNDSLSSPGPADAQATGSHQLDPNLSHQNSNTFTITSCACLSTLYLTLSTLNNMKTAADFTFPTALHPLREAMSSAETVMGCEECPRSFNTGLQNTTMLGTLFLSIAERFSKVLEQIDVEAARAERDGERKRFRLTDLNGENGAHLHLGGAGCAAAFSLELSPREWRTMCKKVVRAEVVGSADGTGEYPGNEEHSQCVYFLGLTKQMEERQERWHRMPLPKDFPRGATGVWQAENREARERQEGHYCLKLVGTSKALVGKFDWN